MRTGALDILEFRVAKQAAQSSQPVPPALHTVERESAAVTTRTITLNECQDQVGNSKIMLLNRKHWHEPVTERPRLNTTEIWEFINETEDTHPMHLHLVRFQILDRRPYNGFEYMKSKRMRFSPSRSDPRPPNSDRKDIVQCPPGLITRITVRFEGCAGSYFYYCHVLEHEVNDMMRPFQVIAGGDLLWCILLKVTQDSSASNIYLRSPLCVTI